MKSIRAKLARIAAAVIASLVLASGALATPVTVVDYSGDSAPGVGFEITSGGIFQTTGGAALASFLNWADFIPQVDAVGKVRVTGVALVGSASNLGSGVYSQSTFGGQIEFFDSANTALLTITFSDGAIILASTGTGGQFTTNVATFSGSLASGLIPTSATHSLSLARWSPVGIIPIPTYNNNDGPVNSYQLQASSGVGNGLATGEQVPEPMTLLLLGSGLFGTMAARRRAA